MMAIAMTLSAFAVFQATRAADAADEALTQARALDSQVTRLSGQLQTVIAGDTAVLAQQCAGSLDRDAAAVSLLSRVPDIETLVTSTIELDALRPLVRGDREAGCATTERPAGSYRVDRALAGLEGQTSLSALSAGAEQLRDQAAVLGLRESALITLGLVFIAALAGLILVDQLGDRRGRPARVHGTGVTAWRTGIVIASAAIVAGGAAALLIAAVDRFPTAVLIAVLAGAAVALWLWVRRRGPSPGPVERPRWWAEILGAVAIVAFAGAAVALSVVSINERDANARAEALTAGAERVQAEGIERAARGLSSLSAYAEAESAAVAAAQLAEIGFDTGADPDTATARREEVDRRLATLEDGLREQFDTDAASRGDGACVFPAPPELTTATAPSALYVELSEPDILPWYVSRTQWSARACDAAAELTRDEISLWGQHRSMLTVTLVVLGLSGFMLGLASGRSRTRRSAVILLAVGTAGIITGLGLTATTVPDAGWRQSFASPDRVDAIAEALATAQTDCAADSAPLARALAGFDRFGPAHEWLGYSLWCAAGVGDGWTVLSAQHDERLVENAVGELLRAEELGPQTPRLESNLGFALITLGIVREDAATVREGLERTERAIALFDGESGNGGSFLQNARLNRALALAALGAHAEALAAYQETAGCLDGTDAECSGDGVADPRVVADTRSWALADLELLAGAVPDARLDGYRWAILGAKYSSVFGLDGAQLSVYPQELQVASRADSPAVDGSAAVVWYHRADDDDLWAVIAAPTAETLEVGAHLEHVIPAGTLLPSGQYRADVYANGVRSEIHLDGVYTAEEGMARYESRRLGVSVVVPDDWFEWQDDGVVWRLGPTESAGLFVQRVEYVQPTEDVDAFVMSELERALGRLQPAGPTVQTQGQWFRGLQHTVTIEYQTEGRTVRGIAGLQGYVSDTGCGASLIAAGIGGDEVSADDLWLLTEIDMTRAPPRVDPIRGRVESDGFAIVVPDGWDAAIRPQGAGGNLFVAKDCRTLEANLLLDREETGRSLAQFVDDALAGYADPAEFPGFSLLDRTAMDVRGAAAAQVLEFTWDSDGDGEADDHVQHQLFAMRDGTVTFLTVTVAAGAADRYEDDVARILSSLEVRATGG
jgi:hypothetical protein